MKNILPGILLFMIISLYELFALTIIRLCDKWNGEINIMNLYNITTLLAEESFDLRYQRDKINYPQYRWYRYTACIRIIY